MGVAGGDGRLGCLCGKAGISHVVIHSSTHSSGCVVHPYKFLIASFFITKYGIGMGPMSAIVDLWDYDGKILLLLLLVTSNIKKIEGVLVSITTRDWSYSSYMFVNNMVYK